MGIFVTGELEENLSQPQEPTTNSTHIQLYGNACGIWTWAMFGSQVLSPLQNAYFWILSKISVFHLLLMCSSVCLLIFDLLLFGDLCSFSYRRLLYSKWYRKGYSNSRTVIKESNNCRSWQEREYWVLCDQVCLIQMVP